MNQQLYRSGAINAVVATLILNVPKLAGMEISPLVRIIMIATAVFFYIRAFNDFKNAKKAPAALPGQQPPAPQAGVGDAKTPGQHAPLSAPKTTNAEQVKFFTSFIVVALIIFPFLSFMVIRKLNALNAGDIARYQVWEPLARFHEQHGYNATIMVIPAIGILVVAALGFKVYLLKSNRR